MSKRFHIASKNKLNFVQKVELKAKNMLRKIARRKFLGNPFNPPYVCIIGRPKIGKNAWLGPFCLIDGLHDKLTIGKRCDISGGAHILTHSTLKRCISEDEYDYTDHAPTEIGDYCFIGTNAVILMGAKIGHHSVIGAGCVIPQFMEIPPYSVVTGVPGKIVGSSKKYLISENGK